MWSANGGSLLARCASSSATAVGTSAEPEARPGRAVGIVLAFDPAIRMQAEQRAVVGIQPVVCVRHASGSGRSGGARRAWKAGRRRAPVHAAQWGDCKPFGGPRRGNVALFARAGRVRRDGSAGRREPIRQAFQFRNVRAVCRCAMRVDGPVLTRAALRREAWCAPCILQAVSAVADAVGPAIASVGRTYRRRGQENENRPNRNVSCCKHESPTCRAIRFAVYRGDVSARLSVPSEQSGLF